MSRAIVYQLYCILAIAIFSSSAAGQSLTDRNLLKLIEVFEVKALEPTAAKLDAKARLGQALFFDPIVSGPRTIACATCHVRSKGAADGLPVAVGLGASGVGDERLHAREAFLVPRNVLPFFNRGQKEFRALFWDGRVQAGASGAFESPLGSKLPSGFENLLAVAAVLPPAEQDEMLGRPEEKRGNRSQYHGELLEGLQGDTDNFQERTLVVFSNLVKRIVGRTNVAASDVQAQYRTMFTQAYPNVGLEEIGIANIGNALAAYIDVAFALQPAAWDRYVSGDASAITPQQKRGALVFMGKGRCIVCHNGVQYSDFAFHGLAVPQLSAGRHGAYLDYGRAAATSRPVDRFLFRTPPLRNVVSTGPWGHNGSFDTLRRVIEHHFNPVPALHKAQQSFPEAARHAGRLLASRSNVLGEIAPLTESDLADVLSFLEALSSGTAMSDELALPKNVPSGDMRFVRP